METGKGWVGAVLRVELTKNKITTETVPFQCETMIGGRGFGIVTLFNEIEPDAKALDPQNKVVISCGPLVGTLAPAASRVSVETKSQKTGGLCTSNFGGYFGPELKFAGFDAVIVEGVAPEPSVLFIKDGSAVVRGMPELWGLTTRQTESAIRSMPGFEKSQILSIGPAGENLASSACIISNGARASGRGGNGAVLGSKRLKAVVVSGSGGIQVAKPDEFLRYVRFCWAKINRSERISKFREGGTHLTSGAGGTDGTRAQPVRNYRDESWPPERSAKIQEPVFRELFEIRRLACFNCPIYCGHFYRISDGPYSGLTCEGVQTNSVNGFGPNLEIDNPEAILVAHALCNEYGIDVDTAVASIAWAYESYERDLLRADDTDGLELNWGNWLAVPELLKQMAYRKGFGAILSDGVMRAAEMLGRGSDRYAMHVKGADLNEQGMRWNKAWAFGIVTANRGSGHLDGAPQSGYQGISVTQSMEKFGIPTAGDVSRYAENAPLVVWHEAYKAAIDALGMCYFTSYWVDIDLLGPEDYAKLFSLATGMDMDGQQLMLAGRRIQNVSKAFNTLHAGFTRQDDYPPRRLIYEPAKTGPHSGAKLDLEQWKQMLDAYYQEHGWEVATGLQTSSGLNALGLKSVAEKLASYGKLILK